MQKQPFTFALSHSRSKLFCRIFKKTRAVTLFFSKVEGSDFFMEGTHTYTHTHTHTHTHKHTHTHIYNII